MENLIPCSLFLLLLKIRNEGYFTEHESYEDMVSYYRLAIHYEKEYDSKELGYMKDRLERAFLHSEIAETGI